jgi:DNA-binding NarL/FixJ family response regulator
MRAREKTTGLSAIVFDRYPLFLDVLKRLLGAHGIDVRGATTAPEKALELLDEHSPDLLVAGLHHEPYEIDGVTLVRQATERAPGLKVITLSNGNGTDLLDQVFAAGASAYVTNDASSEDLAVAIHQMFNHSIHLAADRKRPDSESAVLAGEAGLTDREIEVLALAAQGHSNAEVARLLWVTPQTVKFHLSNVYRKLNVSNRTQASRWAQLANLAPVPETRPMADAG